MAPKFIKLFVRCGVVCVGFFSGTFTGESGVLFGQENASAVPVAPAPAVDPIVKASAYGDKLVWSYSGDAPLPWTLFKPNDFSTIPVHFDSIGVTPLGRVPAPGIHPRLFFSPEDLPAIRDRIQNTRAGREAWKNVLSYANALKMTYDPAANYAKPDWMNGGYNIHGRVPLYLVGGYEGREDYYSELAAGQRPAKDFEFMGSAAVEALRCLIEEDRAGAQKLALATVSAIKFEQERCEKADPPVAPGQPPNPSTPRLWAISLGMVYDFIFNDLTESQKNVLHDELVNLSAWHDNYGTFNNADTSRSNWATFSYWAFDLMAIEGEPGFNDLKFRGLYRGWRNFMTTSYFDSGAVFEGEGKSLLGLDAVAAFDRAAPKYQLEPLSWHPVIRNTFGNFTVSSMLPTRDNFVCFDMLGGMGRGVCTPIDVVMAKYLYPQDKRIDLVYRAIVGDDYQTLPNRCDWTWNMVVLSAIFATDYDPDNSPEKIGLPLTFFCGQRAMMMTRSSWDKDAAFLTMHVRGASGGHPYRDRNGIMLAAKGRPWITLPFDHGQDNGWMCDTVLIDGREQSNTTPGRVVDFVDKPLASFMVGDAKYCWDWVWSNASTTLAGKPATREDVDKNDVAIGAGWKLIDQSFNDFAYTKINAEAYTRPLKYTAHWLAPDGVVSAGCRQVNTPVLKAFRTTGLVRGTRPYVLVVDDIQRNAMPAQYDWHLTLSQDLVRMPDPVDNAQPGDLFFTGAPSPSSSDGSTPAPTGPQPELLIRILDEKGAPAQPALETKQKENILTISTRAVTPDFKILIYPFVAGDPLPVTQWNAGHSELTLEFPFPDPAPRDRIIFTPEDSGKTDVRILRNNEEIINVNHPVPKLNDPDSDALTENLTQLPARLAAMKDFDPDKIPGLIASWSFDQILDGKFPANQPNVPGVPAATASVEPGRIGGAARLPAAGVEIPFDLRDKIQSCITTSFWVKSDPDPQGTLLDFEDNRAFSFDVVQGSLRFNAQGQWFYGGTISAAMLGDWTHFAITDDGKMMVLYRDGLPVMSLPGDKKLEFRGTIQLGTNGFQGLFDDLRIYDRVLDADTINKIYLKGSY